MEDIINRGGGSVPIRVYNSAADGALADSDAAVCCGGRTFTVPAGTQIRLRPGESITVRQYMYHDFEVEPGTGPVLPGEASMCSDGESGNRFYEPIGRFPAIEEDESPTACCAQSTQARRAKAAVPANRRAPLPPPGRPKRTRVGGMDLTAAQGRASTAEDTHKSHCGAMAFMGILVLLRLCAKPPVDWRGNSPTSAYGLFASNSRRGL